MQTYKQDFIDFMLASQALSFGSFVLKSGRTSPFFMNAGAYVTGSQLQQLGRFYARAIHEEFGDDFDVLFGPAYKGIPLAVTTSMAYAELYHKDVRYCANRKELKDHGADEGSFLGSELHAGDRVVMIEDVTTSGKSIDETYPLITSTAKIEVVGLIVSLNREEVGREGNVTAQEEIQQRYGFPVASIVSMSEVRETLTNKLVGGKPVLDATIQQALSDYYAKYGIQRA